MDAKQIAQALTKNANTDAEHLSGPFINLTVRPPHSSRTYQVRVEVRDVKEI